MKVLLFIILFAKTAVSIETHFGSCPKINEIVTSNRSSMEGVWYDVMKYPSRFVKGKCLTFELKQVDPETVLVTSKEYDHGILYNVTRTGKLNQDGSIDIDFTFLKFSATFYILGTDYKNFLVAFGCKNIAYMANLQMAFIWARQTTLSEEYAAKAYEILNRNGISTSELEKSEQYNCH